MTELDLLAVDAALQSGRADASDTNARELQELALALQADSPEPDPAFAGRLGERVRDGFPRERRFALPALKRPPLPVLAGAATVLLALAVAIPLLTKGSEKDSASSVGALAEKQAAPVGGAEALSAPSRQARIERSAMLTLAAPEDEIDRVAGEVTTVTDRHDGFVLRSSVASGDDAAPGGSFELRVPQSQLQAALRDLSALGDVRSRSQSGQDVTREYGDAADRLGAARAERKSLLRRLAKATSDTQAESIRRRLDIVGGQIRGYRAQLRDLRLRTDYAKVELSLVEKHGKGGASPAPGSTGRALDDAVGSLVGAANIVLRALGYAIPLGLVALALWLAARVTRRRRRESALV